MYINLALGNLMERIQRDAASGQSAPLLSSISYLKSSFFSSEKKASKCRKLFVIWIRGDAERKPTEEALERGWARLSTAAQSASAAPVAPGIRALTFADFLTF